MKKFVQMFIVVILVFPINVWLERNVVIERFGSFAPFNSIDLINPVNQNRFERSAAIEQFERLEHFFDSINQFNQSPAWAQSSETQPVPEGVQVPPNYVIGQGDVLEVFVWRNEQLSRQVVVRPDGKISLPLIQDVQAEGLTVLWLKNEITRRFSEYLEHPRVTVIVNQINSYRVSVLGRVVRPGVYPITGKTTLVEAISMAGGFTEWANKRKITVITTEGGEKTKIIVNYKKIVSGKDPNQNIVLKRGDTIIVP